MKKMIAVILSALLVVSSFAGCGKKQDNSSEKATAAPTGTESSASSYKGLTLPLSKEKVTLTMYAGQMDTNLATVAKDINENAFFKEMEKRTNIHIEFQTAPQGSTDSFNLMIASGELPDLIYGPGAYQEGLEAGIKDGYFLDMTPYLDTYLSDYNKLRTQDKETEKNSVTDSGKVAAAYQIYTQQQSPWMGLMIRKDWLDELNLQVPKTVADWETVLTAFKEKKNAYAPLALCGGLSSISKGFNVGTSAIFSSPYMNDNGKVTYTETSDNMKAYLKVLKDWYKKGLIDPDFMTKQNSPFVDTSMVTSDQTGAFVTMYTLADMYKAASKDPKFQLVAVADPVPDAGSETKIGMKIPMVGGAGLAVSADSKNKELAMQWIDYLFTEEGSMLANYGIEGDTYKLGQDGKPVFTEKITKNPDGMSMAQAMALYTLPPSMLPCHYDWTRELAGVSKESQEMMNVWGQQKTDNVMPAITMTSDENKEYASNFNNIKTFTSEQESQFVTGVADIDKGWDEFVNQVNKLGVDKCVQLEQAALDRYLKR